LCCHRRRALRTIGRLASIGDRVSPKCGADLFDLPDRPTLVQLTLFTNKGRGSASQNPDMVVGRLLADHRGDHSGKATEFNMQHVVDGLTGQTQEDRMVATSLLPAPGKMVSHRRQLCGQSEGYVPPKILWVQGASCRGSDYGAWENRRCDSPAVMVVGPPLCWQGAARVALTVNRSVRHGRKRDTFLNLDGHGFRRLQGT